MENKEVFISLGTNLGKRAENLALAIKHIEQRVGLVLKKSSLYETKPWGKSDQPDFLNQVVIVKSTMLPDELLTTLLSIEQDMGRERKEKWGARIIDLDLLYAGDYVIHSAKLTVPHPAIAQRRFVLEPLAEIAPGFVHPVVKKTQQQLLADCEDKLPVIRL